MIPPRHGSGPAKIADTYSRTRCTNDCDYCSLPRPAQSPDATKVLFTSDMLQAQANRQDIYVALHRYPDAPPWLGLASETELLVTWRLHSSLARESAGVRLLRSPDVSPPRFEDVAGVISAGSFLDETTALAEGESVLYATAAVEHSGVESRSLSRVIRVTRSGAGYRVDLVTPYGTRGFDATAPAAPAGLSVASPATEQVRLSWTATAEGDARAYHVYASPTSAPAITRAFRIAALPVDHPTFLDWSSGGGTMHYAVTTVDFQGNESDPARITATPF